MSKAERTTEQMCEACWMHNDPECGYECRNHQRKCTNNDLIGRGYELAEKDLALTWEDVADIVILADTILDDHGEEWRELGTEAYYTAVLKAYNDTKK